MADNGQYHHMNRDHSHNHDLIPRAPEARPGPFERPPPETGFRSPVRRGSAQTCARRPFQRISRRLAERPESEHLTNDDPCFDCLDEDANDNRSKRGFRGGQLSLSVHLRIGFRCDGRPVSRKVREKPFGCSPPRPTKVHAVIELRLSKVP